MLLQEDRGLPLQMPLESLHELLNFEQRLAIEGLGHTTKGKALQAANLGRPWWVGSTSNDEEVSKAKMAADTTSWLVPLHHASLWRGQSDNCIKSGVIASPAK